MGRGFHKSKSPGIGRNRVNGVGGTHHNRKGHNQLPKSLEPFQKKRSSDHVPLTVRPLPKLPQELSGLPKFIEAPRFLGRKHGYYFAKGKDGLGYYLDHVQISKMGDEARARLAASRAATTTTPPSSTVSSGPPTSNSTPVASSKTEKNNRVEDTSHTWPKKKVKLIDGNDSSGGVGKIRGGEKRRSKGKVKNMVEVKHEEHEDREGSESEDDEAEENEDGHGRENDANDSGVGTRRQQKEVREPSGTRRASRASSSGIHGENKYKNDGTDNEDGASDDQGRKLAKKDVEKTQVRVDDVEDEQKLNFDEGMQIGRAHV